MSSPTGGKLSSNTLTKEVALLIKEGEELLSNERIKL
jgi:hypothetical protein